MAIKIEHRLGVQSDSHTIWEVFSDLAGWAGWNPVYPQASGRFGIGEALKVTETVGEESREVVVRVADWVPYEQLIWSEKRGFMSASLRYFEIEELAPGSCLVSNGEVFSGLMGEAYARRRRRELKAAYEALNEALKARVEKG